MKTYAAFCIEVVWAGGVAKLGGEWSKAALGSVAEKINVLDSVFENIAFDLASAGLRQGAVGALQYCLEPIFSHWILDTELTPEQFEGWTSAFLQGALVGMFFEGKIMEIYGLNYDEMFDCFNKPVLDDAIAAKKTIRFSHDPRRYEKGFIVDEWDYIKSKLSLTDDNLYELGGFWYVWYVK